MTIVAELQRNGISVLPDMFDVSPFVDYLAKYPVYPNHIRQGRAEAPRGGVPWMCHDMRDVILAPGWFEKAMSLLSVASAYLGSKTYLYSLNAFYTDPVAFTKRDIQEFHRDGDDSKFLALFLYCTDVLMEDDGTHQFIMGSHNYDGDVSLGPVRTIIGRAGTSFFANTKGLHRGVAPKSRRRMIAWARYGVSDPPAAYVWDRLSPTPKALLGERYPNDRELQEAIKLVVS